MTSGKACKHHIMHASITASGSLREAATGMHDPRVCLAERSHFRACVRPLAHQRTFHFSRPSGATPSTPWTGLKKQQA